MTLAIIPARGGSKGIPRKNVKLLAGKPLIAHIIEQAHQASCIDRLVVSTDDPEIARVAREYGAEVVWRPAAISGDYASSESALLHTVEHLAQSENYHPELLVFLQCTSPLTLSEDIEGTIQALLEEEADSALSVTPFHYFLWHRDESGDAVGINHNKWVRPLRQEREAQYKETGAVYVMRTQGFLQAKHRFFGKTAMYVMPPERCLEIDEPVDFLHAEVLMREQQRLTRLELLPDPPAALVLDFDGVFTDNTVLVSQDGSEAVVCHRGDGMGLEQLRQLELPVLVLSRERNPVVQARCQKLEIPCVHGAMDKLPLLINWLDENSLTLGHVIYVGNDTNDVDCLRAVGCGIAVADATPEAKVVARIVLETSGGHGAVREVTDLIGQKLQKK